MSVIEIETAISQLPPAELTELLEWIKEYRSDAWDREIAQDAKQAGSEHFESESALGIEPFDRTLTSWN